MLFRCTSKTSMLLTFSMNGESFKVKLGSTAGAEEPILSEMVMPSFSSFVFIFVSYILLANIVKEANAYNLLVRNVM